MARRWRRAKPKLSFAEHTFIVEQTARLAARSRARVDSYASSETVHSTFTPVGCSYRTAYTVRTTLAACACSQAACLDHICAAGATGQHSTYIRGDGRCANSASPPTTDASTSSAHRAALGSKSWLSLSPIGSTTCKRCGLTWAALSTPGPTNTA